MGTLHAVLLPASIFLKNPVRSIIPPAISLENYATTGTLISILSHSNIPVAGLRFEPFLNDPSYRRMRSVFVEPSQRNSNLAKILIHTSKYLLQREDPHIKKIFLDVLPTNNPAIACYSRLGFEEQDTVFFDTIPYKRMCLSV